MSADLIDPPHGMSGVCSHCHGMNGEDVNTRCRGKCRKLTITARNMAGASFEIGDVCSGIRIGLLKYLVCRIVFNYDCLYHHMGMSIVDDNYAVLENLDREDDVTRLLEKHIGRGDTLTLAVACNGPILSDKQRRLLPRINNDRRARLLHRIEENMVAYVQPTQLAAPRPPRVFVAAPAPLVIRRPALRRPALNLGQAFAQVGQNLTEEDEKTEIIEEARRRLASATDYGDIYGMRPVSKKTKKSVKKSKKSKKSVKKSKKSAKKSKKSKKSAKKSKKRV